MAKYSLISEGSKSGYIAKNEVNNDVDAVGMSTGKNGP